MAYLDGHSTYQTDCVNFDWRFVNYGKDIIYDSMYSGGSRLYAPSCSLQETQQMFYRPVLTPCEGCPYYEQGTEKGRIPPGGYKV